MKKIFFCLSISLLLTSCVKEEPFSSVVGTYKLGFNAASDGWKLELFEGGKGSLTHMADWEGGSNVNGFKNCKSFTYVVNGNSITFNSCTIGLTHKAETYTATYTISIKEGTIEWGFNKGRETRGNHLSFWADVTTKYGMPSAWRDVNAYQCDSQGKVL